MYQAVEALVQDPSLADARGMGDIVGRISAARTDQERTSIPQIRSDLWDALMKQSVLLPASQGKRTKRQTITVAQAMERLYLNGTRQGFASEKERLISAAWETIDAATAMPELLARAARISKEIQAMIASWRNVRATDKLLSAVEKTLDSLVDDPRAFAAAQAEVATGDTIPAHELAVELSQESGFYDGEGLFQEAVQDAIRSRITAMADDIRRKNDEQAAKIETAGAAFGRELFESSSGKRISLRSMLEVALVQADAGRSLLIPVENFKIPNRTPQDIMRDWFPDDLRAGWDRAIGNLGIDGKTADEQVSFVDAFRQATAREALRLWIEREKGEAGILSLMTEDDQRVVAGLGFDAYGREQNIIWLLHKSGITFTPDTRRAIIHAVFTDTVRYSDDERFQAAFADITRFFPQSVFIQRSRKSFLENIGKDETDSIGRISRSQRRDFVSALSFMTLEETDVLRALFGTDASWKQTQTIMRTEGSLRDFVFQNYLGLHTLPQYADSLPDLPVRFYRHAFPNGLLARILSAKNPDIGAVVINKKLDNEKKLAEIHKVVSRLLGSVLQKDDFRSYGVTNDGYLELIASVARTLYESHSNAANAGILAETMLMPPVGDAAVEIRNKLADIYNRVITTFVV
jgi:hypothetical protein